MIYGPLRDVRKINDKLNAVEFIGGIWAVFCEKVKDMPMIKVFIDGIEYELHSQDYIVQFDYEGRTHCASVFRELPRNPKSVAGWIFGTSFISKFYTVFDFTEGRVGFANLQ